MALRVPKFVLAGLIGRWGFRMAAAFALYVNGDDSLPRNISDASIEGRRIHSSRSPATLNSFSRELAGLKKPFSAFTPNLDQKAEGDDGACWIIAADCSLEVH